MPARTVVTLLYRTQNDQNGLELHVSSSTAEHVIKIIYSASMQKIFVQVREEGIDCVQAALYFCCFLVSVE
jgi:hypothetical protein